MYCDWCRDRGSQVNHSWRRNVYHVAPPHFERNEFCPVCEAISKAYKSQIPGTGYVPHLEVSLPNDSSVGGVSGFPRITQTILDETMIPFYVRNDLFTRNGFPEPEFADYLSGRQLPARTDSQPVFELAAEWLKTCISSHSQCEKRSLNSKIPTRVLEIGDPCPDHIRLKITKDSKLMPPYMTLSHCWGSVSLLTLTAQNIDCLLAGIPISDLPQTFRDAVDVTQRLGARYLWIDSLCILQDSVDDWHHESSSMADVYRGSLCNLAATASEDSLGGFFRERVEVPEPRIMAITTTSDESRSSFDDQTDYLCIYSEHYQLNILEKQEPLLNRGWVLQERILPARVLHFGSKQVFWECCTLTACEIFPGQLPELLIRDDSCLKLQDPFSDGHDRNSFRFQTPPADLDDHSKRCHSYWYKVVKKYSRCSLSYETDKLVAISGVAKLVHSSLSNDTKYVAGLWVSTIIQDLLWFCDTRKSVVRPAIYRAPTWSWASLDGEIDFMPNPLSLDTILVDVTVAHLTEDLFGQVSGGTLRLSGPLLTFPIRKQEAKSSRKFEYSSTVNGEPITFGLELTFDTEADARDDKRLHMLVFSSRDPHLYASFRPTIMGLLLRPTSVARGQFQRCGLFFENDESISVKMGAPSRTFGNSKLGRDKRYTEQYGEQEDVGKWSWADVKNEEWLEYEHDDGDGKYTVSII